MPAEQSDGLREAIKALIDRAEARRDSAHRLVTTGALRAALATTEEQPGRSEEAIKAEALREAASDIVGDCTNQSGPCICLARHWLRDRAEVLSPPEAQR